MFYHMWGLNPYRDNRIPNLITKWTKTPKQLDLLQITYLSNKLLNPQWKHITKFIYSLYAKYI